LFVLNSNYMKPLRLRMTIRIKLPPYFFTTTSKN
jgi:hypothetical protein